MITSNLKKNSKKNSKSVLKGHSKKIIRTMKTDFIVSSISSDEISRKFFEEKEEKFVSFAEVLGFDKLVFCYNVGDLINFAGGFDIKKINEELKNKKEFLFELEEKFNICVDLALIFNMTYNKKISFLLGLKQGNILLYDSSEGFDRELLEKVKPKIIYNLEFSFEKDFIHQRNSGINEAIVRFMQENDIGYGISLSDIKKINKEKHNINVILGRIYQNIKLITDFNVNFNVFSLAKEPKGIQSIESIKSFVKLIGFNTSLVKNSILTKKE